MNSILGWTGGFLLAICGFPQMIQSIKEGNSKGLTHSFLWMWFIGEICLLGYVLPKSDIPLVLNYSANCVMISVIIYYKYFPREKNE